MQRKHLEYYSRFFGLDLSVKFKGERLVVLKRNLGFGILREVKKLIVKLIIDRKSPNRPQTKVALAHGQEGRFGACPKKFPSSNLLLNSFTIHQYFNRNAPLILVAGSRNVRNLILEPVSGVWSARARLDLNGGLKTLAK